MISGEKNQIFLSKKNKTKESNISITRNTKRFHETGHQSTIWPITANTNNQISQSELDALWRNPCQARENMHHLPRVGRSAVIHYQVWEKSQRYERQENIRQPSQDWFKYCFILIGSLKGFTFFQLIWIVLVTTTKIKVALAFGK